MNKVMGFIKANLVVVISVVLILVFLPVGWYFASGWNEDVRTQVEEAYNREKRTLTSRGSVSYALPAVLEGESDLSERRPPNAAVTRFYQEARAERERQVEEVVERGTAFNRGDHAVIVEGILPEAPDPRTMARLGREMAEAIAGTETTPSVYQRKLQRLNAGSPPEAAALAQTLEQIRAELTQRYENANADGNMTEEQRQQLEEELSNRRLAAYIARSKALTFYASPAAFVNGDPAGDRSTVNNEGYSVIPAVAWPPSQIDESIVYTWLWDYWIISDVLDAAALANTNAASGAMAVPEAPVKSIEQIRISGIELPEASLAPVEEEQDYGRGSRFGGGGVDEPQLAGPGSFTGRQGGEAGSPFDIRTIELTTVVASKDLPRFIDAIGKTNYMTVTDMDLSAVDVWEDLQLGFYYGDEHVVRVSMQIESVWLRSWTKPLMPDRIKQALNVPVEAGEQESEG